MAAKKRIQRGIFQFAGGLMLLLLSGCLSKVDTGPGLPKLSQQFSEAMRWQDYRGAAELVHPDVRVEFLERFQAEPDLRVVESRLLSVTLSADGQQADADYLLEYYRLPSNRIKRWHWPQQWRMQRENIAMPGLWQVHNAPPPLP